MATGCTNASDTGALGESEGMQYSDNVSEFVAIKGEPVYFSDFTEDGSSCAEDENDECQLPVVKEEIESPENSSDAVGHGSSWMSSNFTGVEEEPPLIEVDVPSLGETVCRGGLKESAQTHRASNNLNGHFRGSEMNGFDRSYPIVAQNRAMNKLCWDTDESDTIGFKGFPVSDAKAPNQLYWKNGEPEMNGFADRYPVVSLTRLSESFIRSATSKLTRSPIITSASARRQDSPYVQIKAKEGIRKEKNIGPKGALSSLFYCYHCDYVSKNKTRLRSHSLGHLPRKYQCTVCDYKSATSKYLSQHMMIHTGEMRFSCPICPFRARWKGNLVTHLRTHTNERPYMCPLCPHKAKTSSSLKSHMDIHNDVRRWKCPYCPYAAFQKSCLVEHITIHTGEKNKKCPHCDFRTGRSSSLRDHIRLKHVRNKNLLCPYCDYRSAHKGNLQTHVRTHTKERPYACDKCDHRFSTSSGLKIHQRIHAGDRKYACDYCDYRSVQSSTMKGHVDRIHLNLNPLQCYYCDFRTYRKRSLRFHIAGSHKVGVRLRRCNHPGCCYTTLSSSLLAKHRKKHATEKPFVCSQCPFQCSIQNVMKQHIVWHTVSLPFKCKECNFSTTKSNILKKHSLLHNGE